MPTLIQDLAEQLKQEHQIIHAAARELKDLVERPFNASVREKTDWLKSIRDLLVSMNSHLKTHFAFEEFGGFMEEVVGVSPNDSPRVEHLKQEHQTLLAESERLCVMASRTFAVTQIAQLRRKVMRFLEELERHEHVENGLVQRVLTGDLGTTD